MESSARQRTQNYISARKRHPAWLLLASRRAPLVLGCLTSLFENTEDGIAEENALQALSDMLAEYAYDEEYDINANDTRRLAGSELRLWIKRGLVTERGQRIYATDALSSAIQFIESLDNRMMTSTASRLLVVQREIENLEIGLNPQPTSRKGAILRKIKALETELADVEAGNITVLSQQEAIERIREVYTLASGLRNDFRRVEDSWHEADRQLRQSIMSENYHRGDIIDRLLEGQEALLNTPEGRVFDGFLQQIRQSTELENMRHSLRFILSNSAANKALNRTQLADLRWITLRLVKESQSVLQARSRSERDVKGFLKTGLAAEHHRVGNLLTDIMNSALNIDWSRQKLRRSTTPLPPIGLTLGLGHIPVAERLRFKTLDNDSQEVPDFSEKNVNLNDIDNEFWDAFEGLDHEGLINETLELLAKENRSLTIAELIEKLPPVHDLETLALWVGIAREADIEINDNKRQQIVLVDENQQHWLFTIPNIVLSADALKNIEWEF